MVSGLTGQSYEERLVDLNMVNLEERGHRVDMLKTYKMVSRQVSRQEKMERATWFQMVNEGASDETGGQPLQH
jgi:hypothetical protein